MKIDSYNHKERYCKWRAPVDKGRLTSRTIYKISNLKFLMKKKIEKIAIFIDGSNFYYSTSKRGIKINFKNLIKTLVGKRELTKVSYYVAPLDIKVNARKYWQHQKFLNMLREIPKFNVELCTLKKLKADDGKGYVYVIKGDDVKLAHDLLMGAVKDLYDIAIIVSGDEDFLPLIKTVKEYGKKVENAYFSSSSSYNLRKACDSSIHLNKLLPKITKD